MKDLRPAIAEWVSTRHNGGQPIADDESLIYSGMIDSLGIQELAAFLTKLGGHPIAATDIVEQDLDTVALLAEFSITRGGA